MNKKLVEMKMRLAEARSKNREGVKASDEILGSGPLNRDGVPQLPPDQREVKNWPVLDLGIQPDLKVEDWSLKVFGECATPRSFQFQDLQKIGLVEDVSDFHCVTGWSRLGISWKGVRFKDIAEACGVHSEAQFVFVEAYDGYSTNLPLREALKADVLLVFEADGQPLAREHGGPLRMITPQLWAWKGAKWIKSIEFLKKDKPGFWEVRGYSNSAIPWLNDRYTADELPEDLRKEGY